MSWLEKAWEKIKSAFGDKESGSSEHKCPLKETGLLVVVLREDTREPVEGATVDVQGKSPENKKTDKDGIVLFKPLKPSSYKIDVSLPAKLKDEIEPPALAYETVALGACPIKVIHVRPLAKLKVKVIAKSKGKDGKPVETVLDGVKIEVLGRDNKQGTTPKDAGGVTIEKLRSGDYTVRVASMGSHAQKYAMPGQAKQTLAPGEMKEVILVTAVVGKLRIVVWDKEDKPITGVEWELATPVKASGTTANTGLIEATGIPVAQTPGQLRIVLPKAAKPSGSSTSPATGSSPPTDPPPHPPVVNFAEFKDPAPKPADPVVDPNLLELSLKLDEVEAFDNEPGVKSRLHNLGFGCEAEADEPKTTRAVKMYQKRYLKQDNGSGKLADVKADVLKRHDNL